MKHYISNYVNKRLKAKKFLCSCNRFGQNVNPGLWFPGKRNKDANNAYAKQQLNSAYSSRCGKISSADALDLRCQYLLSTPRSLHINTVASRPGSTRLHWHSDFSFRNLNWIINTQKPETQLVVKSLEQLRLYVIVTARKILEYTDITHMQPKNAMLKIYPHLHNLKQKPDVPPWYWESKSNAMFMPRQWWIYTLYCNLNMGSHSWNFCEFSWAKIGFIVNNVVMYGNAAHTEVTLKPSSFLMINVENLCLQFGPVD